MLIGQKSKIKKVTTFYVVCFPFFLEILFESESIICFTIYIFNVYINVYISMYYAFIIRKMSTFSLWEMIIFQIVLCTPTVDLAHLLDINLNACV